MPLEKEAGFQGAEGKAIPVLRRVRPDGSGGWAGGGMDAGDWKGSFDSSPHDQRAPVREDTKGQPPTQKRSARGTPQGGVISPRLANLYRHGFARKFHRDSGPRPGADARRVRSAEDFVILAQSVGTQISDWVEPTVEEGMGLEINRTKTRVVELKPRGTKMDFLGYPLRYAASRSRGKAPFLTRTDLPVLERPPRQRRGCPTQPTPG